jgi:hypothetical protein
VVTNWFNQESGESEIWFRVNPEQQLHGVCSQAVSLAIKNIFQDNDIKYITGRHSCLNKGSFHVFRKNEFSLERFIPQQTFLPNSKIQTDDFKRKKTNPSNNIIIPTKSMLLSWGKEVIIESDNENNTIQWLEIHNFINTQESVLSTITQNDWMTRNIQEF